MLCLGLIGKKMMKPFKLILFRLLLLLPLLGKGNDDIETIPCSPQTIESLLPSISDNTHIVYKAVTWSSKQSCLTCLETDSFTLETESKLGSFSCLDPALNPKCMTTSDWTEAQSKDKIFVISLKYIKPRNCRKVRKLTTKK